MRPADRLAIVARAGLADSEPRSVWSRVRSGHARTQGGTHRTNQAVVPGVRARQGARLLQGQLHREPLPPSELECCAEGSAQICLCR